MARYRHLLTIVLLLALLAPSMAAPQAQASPGTVSPLQTNTPPVAGFGNGLSFDGTNEFVEVPYAADLNPDSFTVEAWVNTRQSTSYSAPFSSRDSSVQGTYHGWNVYNTSAGKWEFWLGNPGSNWETFEGPPVQTNVWTHIAATFSGGTAKFYVDGVLQQTRTGITLSKNTAKPFRIGASDDNFGTSNAAAWFFNGYIDEVRVWNSERTAQQINDYRFRYIANPASESGLVSYWAFNAAASTTLADLTGRHSGTLQNMEANDWVASTSPPALPTDENKPVSGYLKASDDDGNPLAYAIVSQPAHGTVTGLVNSTGAFTYTPSAGYCGTDSFTFKVNDGVVDSNTATSNLTVRCLPDDYGDAPTSTLLANNGPRHTVVSGTRLGALIDSENDGQPTVNADGDDTHGQADEDGVAFNTGRGLSTSRSVMPGLSNSVAVNASVSGFVSAWIDANKNGSFADAGEQMLNDQAVISGTNTLTFTTPGATAAGTTYMRFRFSSQRGVANTPIGAAPDGEVEDYKVQVEEPGLAVGNSAPISYTEQAAPVAIAPNLSLTLNPSNQLSAARIEIGSGYQSGQDALGIGASTATSGTTSGLSWAWDAASGTLVISGTANAATYQSLLRQVSFRNPSDTPTSAQRAIRISLGAGQEFAGNGHFYEFVPTVLPWTQARSAAAARSYFGRQGYLPTILSQAEADFALNKLGGKGGWIGASDALTEGTWRWVTGPEGLEDSGKGRIFANNATAVSGQYINWNAGEPNGGTGNPTSDYAYFIRKACSFTGCVPGKWDDVSSDSTTVVDGYVVEYGGMPGDTQVTLAGSAQVNVTPVNDAPTAISLSATSIGENLPAGTLVGTLSATDADHTSGFTYQLVAGTGDADNAAFSMLGSQIKTASTFDFEAKASYSIRVRVTDPAGTTFEQPLTITVTDNPLAPTFTSQTPPAGSYGDPYQFVVSASGEPAPTFTRSSGTLPPGMTLAPSGLLSGTLTTPGVYTFTVQANVPGATSASQQVVISVQQAPLSIHASNETIKTTNTPALDYTITGLKGSDTEAALSAVQISSTGNAASPAGTYPITLAGGTSPNYATSYVTGTLTILNRDVPVVTWDSVLPTVVYGEPLSARQLSAVVTNPTVAGQPLPGTLSYSPTLGAILDAGNGQRVTLTFTPTDGTNFAPVTVVRSLDVAPAPLSITADDKTIFAENALPTLTARYTGLVNGDTSADLDVLPLLSTNADGSTPTTAPINVSGASDPNYAITYVPGTLTVLEARRAPQFTSPTPPQGRYGTPYDYAASAVGTPNTFVYTLTGTLPNGLTFDPATGRISGTPSQAGSFSGLTLTADNGIAPAATRPLTLTINKAPLTVTADDLVKKQGSANPTLTLHYTGFAPGDSEASLTSQPTASTTATAGSAVGSYPITLAGGSDARYELILVNGTLRVTAQDVPVITWSGSVSLTYGTALTAAQLNATADCNGTPLTSSNAQFLYNPPLGSVPSAGTKQRLEVTVIPQIATCATVTKRIKLTVTPAALTITAPSLTIPAGTALPTLTPRFSGLVAGDSGAGLAVPPVLTTAADKNVAGAYPVRVSGASDPNYNISFVDGTLTVQTSSSTAGVTTGAPLSSFPFTAIGFTPGTTVTLTVNDKVIGTYVADPNGKIGASVFFDSQTPAGSYTIKATAGSVSTQQAVTIDPTAPVRLNTQGLPGALGRPARPGSVVPIFSGGYQAGEQVDVMIDGRRVGTITADANGNVSAALDLDSHQAASRVLTFVGRTTGAGGTSQVATDPNGPLLTDPNAGRPGGPPILGVTPGGPGSYFPLSLEGFTPGQVVPVLIDGKQAGSVTADADGKVKMAIYLDPNTQPGQHTVRVGPSGPSATFTVASGATPLSRPAGLPVVQKTNEVGAPGGYFPFTASGFTPGETVEITRDGIVLGRLTADSNGQVQAVVKFYPNAPAGNHEIGAAGQTSGLNTTTVMTLDPNAPERHDPGNLPVLSAYSRRYLPIIMR